MQHTRKWIGWIFVGVGAALLVLAAVEYQQDAAFARKARSAMGEVVELMRSSSTDSKGRSSATYTSRIRFVTADGRPAEFIESISTNPPRHAQGEQVPVLYDPERPSHAVADDFWARHGGLAIVGPLGVIFAAVGAILSTVTLRMARRRERLLRSGRRIEAEFLKVFEHKGVMINGRHPFRVAAQANDPTTGKLRQFESPSIWVDPTARLQGRTVPVLLGDRGDDYLMDLTGIVDDTAFS